ncbi:phage tail protein [Paraburkholderia sp. 31.1]|uniref:phage tail protein n=2 Tax=unclassified Paraburkholderia TaxID=2615204 RepID=UPI001655056B|nr:phage tail protein [Paraburkholderia sp. 31.1]MBC8724331.1 phage tail protein [Paraburkholderia sp. 31.1]
MLTSNTTPDDFYLAFAYSVMIDQKTIAGFAEVSGLAMETEVETYREGGWNNGEHQLAGPTKYSSRIVLKRGFGDIPYLWNWYLGVMKGTIQRRDVTLTINCVNGAHGDDNAPNWVFRKACPVKWTGPELRAATSAIAFETVELVHQGLML